MGFEITFEKPPGLESAPNRVWVSQFLAAFTEFSEVESDHEAAGRDLADDIGMSPTEYVSRGIGLQVDRGNGSDGSWMYLGFWESSVTLTVPTFPEQAPAEVIASIDPIYHFFRAAGFVLVDAESGEPIPSGHEHEALLQGYARRQIRVNHVAELVGGTVSGAKPE